MDAVQAAIQAAIAKAAAEGPNMNEASKGGGEYKPPAAGPCLLSLVAYVELGQQKYPARGKFPAGIEEQVELVFEIHGKGHEPKELDDGTFLPERVTVKLKKSLNEKAWYYKIFKQLNYAGKHTHMAQCVGEMFKGQIFHSTPAKEGDRVYANLRDDNGYKFGAAVYNPDPTDLTTIAPFPTQRIHTELKVFLWDYASKEMWDSLYIDGEWEERKDEKTGKVITPAKSKNVWQNKIKEAVNFAGSPISDIIGNDAVLDLPETDLASANAAAEQPESKAEEPGKGAVDDALAGLL